MQAVRKFGKKQFGFAIAYVSPSIVDCDWLIRLLLKFFFMSLRPFVSKFFFMSLRPWHIEKRKM